MTQHNIIGRERSGPHVVVRHLKRPARRTYLNVVLEAVGGVTLLTVLVIVACKALWL